MTRRRAAYDILSCNRLLRAGSAAPANLIDSGRDKARMKNGIFCAYWEKPSGTPAEYYIDKAKNLGFDVIELGVNFITNRDDGALFALRDYADKRGIGITIGFGPPERLSLCSEDAAVREAGIANLLSIM